MLRQRTVPVYLLTWLALALLTALTFGLSFVDLGGFQTPVAMTIAVAKGMLVLLFFMHLLEERASSIFALAFGVAMVLLLISLSSLDVATRDPISVPDSARRRSASLDAFVPASAPAPPGAPATSPAGD